MTTIREKSTAALAEALHHLGIACSPFRGSVVVSPSGASPLDRVVLSCETGYHRPAAEALAASPTLARRLDFATAWDEAVAALPDGWLMRGVAWESFNLKWSANAGPISYRGTTCYADDPTEALVALTEALREAQR